MRKKYRICLSVPNDGTEIGLKYNKITLIKSLKHRKTNRKLYLIKCECGIEKTIERSNLINGTTKTCGNRVCTGQVTHGMFQGKKKNAGRTPEYITWDNIMRRANPKTKQSSRHYNSYAKKFKKTPGISEEWKAFENFLRDMGMRPSKNHSIDRINNDLGYSKENCRWATKKEQVRNSSHPVFFNVFGERLCKLDIYKKYKMSPDGLNKRLKSGFSASEAIIDYHKKWNKIKRRKKIKEFIF